MVEEDVWTLGSRVAGGGRCLTYAWHRANTRHQSPYQPGCSLPPPLLPYPRPPAFPAPLTTPSPRLTPRPRSVSSPAIPRSRRGALIFATYCTDVCGPKSSATPRLHPGAGQGQESGQSPPCGRSHWRSPAPVGVRAFNFAQARMRFFSHP